MKRTWPGITLVAPGAASMRPTVPTRSGSRAQRDSTASTHSAAAASASRRSGIGTVPACPAIPSISTAKRFAPLIAVTTPTGRPSASSTGPCSMCSSAYASTSARRRAASRDAFGVEPERRQRLAHRRARAIAAVEQPRVERAGDRAAAQQRRAEAHAFLVGEAHDLDRERQARAARVQRVDAIDRGHDAQHAVVLAGIAHGVEVRAQHQARRARRRAFVAADHVADRVEPALIPASRIQASTSSFAARCSCDRNTRVSAPGSSLQRASASQRSQMRRPEGWMDLAHAALPGATQGCRSIQCRAMSARRHTHTRSWRPM